MGLSKCRVTFDNDPEIQMPVVQTQHDQMLFFLQDRKNIDMTSAVPRISQSIRFQPKWGKNEVPQPKKASCPTGHRSDGLFGQGPHVLKIPLGFNLKCIGPICAWQILRGKMRWDVNLPSGKRM